MSRLGPWVEQPVIVPRVLGPGVEPTSAAPTPTCNDLAFDIMNEVSAVGDQHGVDVCDVKRSALGLSLVVKRREQLEH